MGVHRRRPAETVTLTEGQSESLQRQEFGVGLNALRHERGPQVDSEDGQSARQSRPCRVGIDSAGERDLELDHVGNQAEDVAQAGEAGPGVVLGNADSVTAETAQRAQESGVALDGDVFGELQDDAPCRDRCQQCVQAGIEDGPRETLIDRNSCVGTSSSRSKAARTAASSRSMPTPRSAAAAKTAAGPSGWSGNRANNVGTGGLALDGRRLPTPRVLAWSDPDVHVTVGCRGHHAGVCADSGEVAPQRGQLHVAPTLNLGDVGL